jgi:UDPglucose 6-dehydrogenase
MNVCVIGTGYVGLVTGTVFADLGNDVICIDADRKKIEGLRRGKMPIYEPGLEEMVLRNVEEARLSFSTSIREGVRHSDVIFIAVGTPPKRDGETDLSQVSAVAQEIARHIDTYKIIVNKSTVPLGTGNLVRSIIEKHRRQPIDFHVVSNPEFLREGSAIADSLYPDRIVIGAPDRKVAMALLELYAPLEVPMLITDVPSAEMIKYASNAFLATKISFINMVANICESGGANVADVAKGMGYDHRIGREFLQAGLGYGGSCFPKDTISLVHVAKRFGEDAKLLEDVIGLNEDRVPRLIRRLLAKIRPAKGKTVAILGLAFKPDTDDLRDAKSIEIIQALKRRGVKIRAYDPIALDDARALLRNGVTFCKNAYDAVKGADAAVIVTEWREFKQLNLERLRAAMRCPVLCDGRNIYDPDHAREAGFDYLSIGRG